MGPRPLTVNDSGPFQPAKLRARERNAIFKVSGPFLRLGLVSESHGELKQATVHELVTEASRAIERADQLAKRLL
jgi:hypothetical protein